MPIPGKQGGGVQGTDPAPADHSPRTLSTDRVPGGLTFSELLGNSEPHVGRLVTLKVEKFCFVMLYRIIMSTQL